MKYYLTLYILNLFYKTEDKGSGVRVGKVVRGELQLTELFDGLLLGLPVYLGDEVSFW